MKDVQTDNFEKGMLGGATAGASSLFEDAYKEQIAKIIIEKKLAESPELNDQGKCGSGAGGDRPNVEKPNVDKPDSGNKPSFEKPNVDKPDSGNKPSFEKPQFGDKPNVQKPDMEKPEMQIPNVIKPGHDGKPSNENEEQKPTKWPKRVYELPALELLDNSVKL